MQLNRVIYDPRRVQVITGNYSEVAIETLPRPPKLSVKSQT